jgi:hypothetical protein
MSFPNFKHHCYICHKPIEDENKALCTDDEQFMHEDCYNEMCNERNYEYLDADLWYPDIGLL